mmetsp:Transcript_44602/g.136045  ORF Transcript_44602/g.136045 Transcript_44602/m.136045 type:complete len:210 (+) Transcript_44602:683-1312(+)
MAPPQPVPRAHILFLRRSRRVEVYAREVPRAEDDSSLRGPRHRLGVLCSPVDSLDGDHTPPLDGGEAAGRQVRAGQDALRHVGPEVRRHGRPGRVPPCRRPRRVGRQVHGSVPPLPRPVRRRVRPPRPADAGRRGGRPVVLIHSAQGPRTVGPRRRGTGREQHGPRDVPHRPDEEGQGEGRRRRLRGDRGLAGRASPARAGAGRGSGRR